jgi:hypothetical protein
MTNLFFLPHLGGPGKNDDFQLNEQTVKAEIIFQINDIFSLFLKNLCP